MTISQQIDTVLKVNQLIKESWIGEDYEYPMIIIECDGYNTNIKFLETPIFNADIDKREYYEGSDSYEDFEEYLIRMVNTIIKELSTLEI